MNEYHKIDSVFKRDPETKHKTFIMGDWARPEFGYLAYNQWVFTEKVDGTNIRVKIADVSTGDFDHAGFVTFGGRTDAAQIPSSLLEKLYGHFNMFPYPTENDEDSDRYYSTELAYSTFKLRDLFPNGATLYGEGYGAKIQKGGGNYRPDQDFVLFDVKVGDVWLERHNVEDVAAKLGLDVVPICGYGTLHDAISIVRGGFLSSWGSFRAEGIVARPVVELMDRGGRRIITKIKHRDFTAAMNAAAE